MFSTSYHMSQQKEQVPSQWDSEGENINKENYSQVYESEDLEI